MVKFIAILVGLFLINPNIKSQNKVIFMSGYGNYLSNSENNSKIIGDKKFKDYIFFGFSIQKEDILNLNLILDFNYNKINLKRVLEFARIAEESPEIIDVAGADLSLISYNFDLNYVINYHSNLNFGIGPSFVINNRIFKVPVSSNSSLFVTRTFYDKLASSGLGVNGFVEVIFPFSSSEKNFIFFSSKLKFRYTHSIWFDEGLRKLDNYYQEFSVIHLSAGFGYSF